MAKRESHTSVRESKQTSLFDTTPKVFTIDREGLDAKYQALRNAGQPTYRTNGYTFTCLVCNRTSTLYQSVEHKFCFECIITHDVPLDQQ